MGRIYYTHPYTEQDAETAGWEGPQRAGYFSSDAAEYYVGSKDWDGNNNVDRNTGSQWHRQGVYRTKQGRWVLAELSSVQGQPDTYTLMTDEQARDWLLLNDEDDAVERHFGEIEEERGPGRPEIGGRITTAIGDDLLARVETWASEKGVNRAAAVRELLTTALGKR